MDLIYEVTLSLLQDSRESNDFLSPPLTLSINLFPLQRESYLKIKHVKL